MALEPLPPSYTATRKALHLVAERLIAPARKPDNEIALMRTPGGFGTPEFEYGGSRRRVRVEGPDLVVERDGERTRSRLTGLAAGATALEDLLPAGPPDDAPLEIDPAAAERLADFYAFAADLLEGFRAGLETEDDPSPIRLWPEHFDIALESGAESGGARANYGASPGDGEHPEPYVYVGPWTVPEPGPLWNASAFPGAELTYAELLGAADPEAEALEFIEIRRRALAA